MSGDGIHNNVYPDDLKPGDLLLWYEDEENYGICTFEWYSKDGGIYACKEGGVIDSHIVGKVAPPAELKMRY